MKNKFFWGLIAGLVLLAGVSASVSAETTAADRPGFTAADSEFYLEDSLYFFFRPGLEFEITDYEIPSDLHPVVTFTVTDPSELPLDMDGVYTPGVISIRFFISYIPVGEEQPVTYVFRSNGRPTSDSSGTYTSTELGTYTYRYNTALPADYAKDATTIISAVASRDLGEFDLARYDDYDLVYFVPDGSTEPMPRDVVDSSACKRCHDPFPGHGNGRYQAVPICENCHNPGLYNEEYGLSYSFNAMIHRIHSNNEPHLAGEHVDYPVLPGSEWYDCSVCHTGGIPTEDLPMIADPNPAEACRTEQDHPGVGGGRWC